MKLLNKYQVIVEFTVYIVRRNCWELSEKCCEVFIFFARCL